MHTHRCSGEPALQASIDVLVVLGAEMRRGITARAARRVVGGSATPGRPSTRGQLLLGAGHVAADEM